MSRLEKFIKQFPNFSFLHQDQLNAISLLHSRLDDVERGFIESSISCSHLNVLSKENLSSLSTLVNPLFPDVKTVRQRLETAQHEGEVDRAKLERAVVLLNITQEKLYVTSSNPDISLLESVSRDNWLSQNNLGLDDALQIILKQRVCLLL